MKSQICIMIECDSERKIFTNKKNLTYVIEFAKNFNLKLHYAKTDSRNIVSLEKLAKLFCDQSYQTPEQYKIIKQNINATKETRKNVTDKAKQIREKISNLIVKKKRITFKEIQEKFEKENISVSALSNHFAHVRHDLSRKGIVVAKIKNGIYEVQAESKKVNS